MTKLVETYLEELATGNLPAENSPEAIAYREWSAEYEAQVRWAQRQLWICQVVSASVEKVYGNEGVLFA